MWTAHASARTMRAALLASCLPHCQCEQPCQPPNPWRLAILRIWCSMKLWPTTTIFTQRSPPISNTP